MKRICKLLPILLLLSCILAGCSNVKTVETTEAPATVDTSDPFLFDGPYWGTYAIIGVKEECRDALTVVTIPEKYNGDDVTDLRSECFENCKNMTSLTIPATIESIGSDVFTGCDKLTEIKIYVTSPSMLSVPESGAFDGASPSLKVYVPRAVLSTYCSNYSWMNYQSILFPFDP